MEDRNIDLKSGQTTYAFKTNSEDITAIKQEIKESGLQPKDYFKLLRDVYKESKNDEPIFDQDTQEFIQVKEFCNKIQRNFIAIIKELKNIEELYSLEKEKNQEIIKENKLNEYDKEEITKKQLKEKESQITELENQLEQAKNNEKQAQSFANMSKDIINEKSNQITELKKQINNLENLDNNLKLDLSKANETIVELQKKLLQSEQQQEIIILTCKNEASKEREELLKKISILQEELHNKLKQEQPKKRSNTKKSKQDNLQTNEETLS